MIRVISDCSGNTRVTWPTTPSSVTTGAPFWMSSCEPWPITTFCENGSLVSYWISTGVDWAAIRARRPSTARRCALSDISWPAWLACSDSARLRSRSCWLSWRSEALVAARSAAPMNRSRGTSAARCSGNSAVPRMPRTISSVLKRASETRSAIASATKKISRASAEGPCLKRGGGLYSMVGAGRLIG
ncbi:hypothetical protein XF14_04615 [Burkholderia gladioli]|nr:hypothetical protein XF14_04615 [Burkholderia gladioli]